MILPRDKLLAMLVSQSLSYSVVAAYYHLPMPVS